MPDTSGPTSGKQFATYDPDSQSWRTWPATGLWGSIEYSGTWPKTGYMSDGQAYELPTSEPPTDENDFSSLLPTPAVNDMGSGKTPEAWDEWTAEMKAKHANGNGHGKSLAIEAQRLLPTPTSRDWKDGAFNPNVPENALLGRAVWSIGDSTEPPSDGGN